MLNNSPSGTQPSGVLLFLHPQGLCEASSCTTPVCSLQSATPLTCLHSGAPLFLDSQHTQRSARAHTPGARAHGCSSDAKGIIVWPRPSRSCPSTGAAARSEPQSLAQTCNRSLLAGLFAQEPLWHPTLATPVRALGNRHVSLNSCRMPVEEEKGHHVGMCIVSLPTLSMSTGMLWHCQCTAGHCTAPPHSEAFCLSTEFVGARRRRQRLSQGSTCAQKLDACQRLGVMYECCGSACSATSVFMQQIPRC